MTDKDIIKALDDADVFLRNRANAKPAPLNEYDIEILLDIAKICDEAVNIINRQQTQLDNYSHNVRTMTKDVYKYLKALEEANAEIERLKKTVDIHKGIAEDWKYEAKKLKEMVGE